MVKLLKILLGIVVAGAAATALLYLALTSEWASDRVRLRMVQFLEDGLTTGRVNCPH